MGLQNEKFRKKLRYTCCTFAQLLTRKSGCTSATAAVMMERDIHDKARLKYKIIETKSKYRKSVNYNPCIYCRSIEEIASHGNPINCFAIPKAAAVKSQLHGPNRLILPWSPVVSENLTFSVSPAIKQCRRQRHCSGNMNCSEQKAGQAALQLWPRRTNALSEKYT